MEFENRLPVEIGVKPKSKAEPGDLWGGDEAFRQAELDKMKRRATALFWLVTAIFVVARIFENHYPWLGFVRATAEAAMVGAIADWFAVTALFRHPLNLKIPHTAIIPNRKDRIAQNFGIFVQSNFLSEEVIAGRLRSMNLAGRMAHWLSQPENGRQIARHVAVSLAAITQVVKDEDVQEMIERGVVARLRSIRIAPLLANGLSLLTSDNRHQDLLYRTLKLLADFLKENKGAILKKIDRETPWWLPPSVDEAIYQKFVSMIDETLQNVSANPNHLLYQKFDEQIQRFVENLKNSPDIPAREEALKEELLQHPIVQEFSASLWLDLKTSLLEHSSNPNAEIQASIQQGLTKFGETLLHDAALRHKVNAWSEEIARYLIRAYGDEIGQLIAQTIRNWDTEATSRKIELNIGRDLQFIRINGTLVGGLVGLAIYCLSLLFEMF